MAAVWSNEFVEESKIDMQLEESGLHHLVARQSRYGPITVW